MPVKVKMLKTTPGSTDGIRVQRFEEDQVVELPDILAKAFVEDMKVAEYVSRRAQPAEAKALGAAPENKAGGGSNGKEGVQQADAGQEAGKEEVAAKPRQATRAK